MTNEETVSQQVPNLVGDDFFLSLIEAFVVENGIDKEPAAVQEVFRSKVGQGLLERIAAFILETTPDDKLMQVFALSEQVMPYSEREPQMVTLVPNYKTGMTKVLEEYRVHVRDAFRNF